MQKMKSRSVKWYGCKRDTRDARDRLFKPKAIRLPAKVDLRDSCPPVMNQGNLGSCVAHGTTSALRHVLIAAGKEDTPLSRLQLYYDGRVVEGTVREDSGLEIRDAIKCAAKIGVGHESLWRYQISRFMRRPPKKVYADAPNFNAISYERVDVDVKAIKRALASGLPVIIGVSLYDSFEGDDVSQTGVVPMPNLSREQMIGGHCMLIVGYGQRSGCFTVRNSWGADWGDGGDCYMPEKYLGSPSYGADYWIVRTVG